MMTDVRITDDDLIPRIRDAGVASVLKTWLSKNCPEDVLLWIVSNSVATDLNRMQLFQIIAELKYVGELPQADISGDNLPNVGTRPAVPSGIGCSGGNVWVTPPSGSYTLRFYVNGALKLTSPDYYITTLDSIGAVVGDVVQICQITADTVPVCGWWARIVVT